MPQQAVDIPAIFSASTDVLASRLSAIRAAFHHGGMKGAAVEAAVRSLLEEILPNNLAVGSGIVIDSDLNASKQVDIVIYDRAATPTFFSMDGASLFPVECVYFAIEVKTTLDTGTFSQCVANMDSVKNLHRAAYYKIEGPITSSFSQYRDFPPTDHWETIFLVIAMEAASKDSAAKLLEEHRESQRPMNRQIDSMFVVDTGCFSNHRLIPPKSFGVSLLPSDDSVVALTEEDGLLTFLAHFSSYYNQASLGRKFDFTRYVTLPARSEIPRNTERTRRILQAAQDQGFQLDISEGGQSARIKPRREGG